MPDKRGKGHRKGKRKRTKQGGKETAKRNERMDEHEDELSGWGVFIGMVRGTNDNGGGGAQGHALKKERQNGACMLR